MFVSRLEAAKHIFGDQVFRLFEEKVRTRLSRPLYDAVMVAVDQLWADRESLVNAGPRIRTALNEQLVKKDRFYEIVVGRPNTATAISERIRLVRNLMEGCFR